jgi:hypothetical protein
VKPYEFSEPIRNTDKFFCFFIPKELSSANLAVPTGDNPLQEERQAANQLQPFTYSYNKSSFFWNY